MLEGGIYHPGHTDHYRESIRFFEDFNFKFLMEEIDQTPTKSDYILDKDDMALNEPFTLTPYGAKALNLLLNSPNNNSEELQKSIRRLTPYPGGSKSSRISSTKKSDNKNDIYLENRSPNISRLLKCSLLQKPFQIHNKENEPDLSNAGSFQVGSNLGKNPEHQKAFLNGYLKNTPRGNHPLQKKDSAS